MDKKRQGAPKPRPMILVPLPDLGDEAEVWVLADLPPGFRPVNVSGAHQYAFTICPFRVGHMQVGGVWKQQGQSLLEVHSKMGAGHLQVGQVEAEAQLQRLGFGGEFPGHHENVLMTLTPEVPGEGGHVLGNEFGAAEVDLGAGVMETLVEHGALVDREGLVGREAAHVRHDQHRIGVGEKLRDDLGGGHDPLQVVDGAAPIGQVVRGQIQQFAVFEEFGGMDYQSRALGLVKIGSRVDGQITVGQMEFEKVGLDPIPVLPEIVIANRHPPFDGEAVGPIGLGPVAEVAIEQKVAAADRPSGPAAE